MADINRSKEELLNEIHEIRESFDTLKVLYQKEQKIHEETNFLLKERMKEIECQYKISEIMGDKRLTVAGVLQRIAESIPVGWQFPEIAVVCIEFEGNNYQTVNFARTNLLLERNILIAGKTEGKIMVCYLPGKEVNAENPFLVEEHTLINSIAHRIGDFIHTRRIRESLQESDLKYRNLIENINDVIFEINDKAIITYISPSVERIFGYRPDELVGKSFLSFVGENSEYLANRFAILRQTGEIKNEYRIMSKSGEAHWLRFSTKAIIENNEFKGANGTLVDITQSKIAEIALQNSEALYRSMLHASPDLITITDLEGNIKFSSPKAMEMFGLEHPDQAKGLSFLSFLAPGEHERAMTNIGKLIRGEISGAEEYIGLRTNGTTLDIEVNGEFIRDAEGNPTGMIFITRDITERKRTEERLKKSEETFRFLVETINDAIYEVDNQGIVNYVSPVIQKIVGYTAEELIGKNFFEYMYPEDRPILMNALANLGSNDYSYLEYRYITKDGEVRWVQSSTSPIIRDGVMVGGTGSLTNIHQRKLAEQELHKLSRAVEQSPVSIVITNLDGSIEYANPKASETTGYTLEELKGKNPRVLKSGETSTDEYAHLWNSISAGNQWQGVFHNKRKNGELYWESSVITPILNEFGLTTHYLAIKEDITEKRKTEEALKQSEKRFSQLAEQSQTVIWEIDATGRYTYVNSMSEQVWGYSPEELIGKMYFYDLHPAADRMAYKEKTMNQLAGKSQFKNIENQIVTRDGRLIWVLTNCIPVLDEAENLIGYRGADNDITEKHYSEEKIKSQNDKLNAIIRAIPDLMFVIDASGIFQEYYHTDQDGLLVPEDSIIGTSIRNIFDSETADLHMSMIDKCINEKTLVTYEYSINFKNSNCFYEARITPLRDDRVLTFVRDITEKKQKDNEIKKLSLAVEQSPATIVITDLNAGIEYVNPAFEATTGYRLSEVVGQSTKILKSGHTEPRLYKEMWETITVGKEWHGEWINKKKNGELFWESILITPIHDEKNVITNYLAIKQDITNRKNAENEIRELNASLEIKIKERTNQLAETNKNLLKEIEERKRSEIIIDQTRQNYETFFNSIDELLWVLDLNGAIIHINNIVTDTLKYSLRELKNNSFISMFVAGRRDEAATIIGQMLAGSVEICTIPMIARDGKQVPVETRVKHGFWNGQAVLFGVSKDITEIKLSEEKFATAFHFNSAMMAISYFDGGSYIDVNNTMCESLGYSREELVGSTNKALNLFVDPYLRNQLIKDLNQNIPVRKREILMRTKDGEIKTGMLSADKIVIGDRNCLLTVTMDITERKKMEDELREARIEAEKANLAKSEFLSRMSHELRTPMNSILGFAQLLEMSDLNAGQRKGVGHILKSGKHLLDLINEVLDLSRIEAGRLSLSMEPVQLRGVLKEMMDVVRLQANEKAITIELDPTSQADSFVKSDRQRLKQVLLNLINNAIKYNKQGGSVTLKTEVVSDGTETGNNIRISVKDTGIGLEKTDIPKLFVPFERVGAEKSETEGTGLGLAVVKKLLDAMGGKLGVESEKGVGSTFWIEMAQSESPQEIMIKGGALNGMEPFLEAKSGIILYVEDNLSNIELVEQILGYQRSNIRLITTTHGNKALDLALNEHPDLILLDLNLPDIHGSEVIKYLQSNDQTKNIPIVIISADAMPHQLEKLLNSGARKYLTKPLDVNEFLKIIDEFIHKSDE